MGGAEGAASSLDRPALALMPIATNLTKPVAIAHAGDGSGRLFIALQEGQIVIHDGQGVLPVPFLDIRALVSCCGEQGLLGLTFHPRFAENGLFFVNYTDRAGDTVIARYSVSISEPDRADPDSAATLLTISQPFTNHNGGQLKFGPDGYLYVGMGDGGSGGDPQDNAQNLASLLGKMLRIDVDGALPYTVPPDNPFVTTPGARPEIWALGLRNPWRFTFDRVTGDLFIGDVGQNLWEEINLQPAASPGGENYGWRRMEGTHCFNPPASCNPGTLTLPIIEYSHALGCSVTGGYRYRGQQIPELYGTYLYADFCSGRVWGASQDGAGRWSAAELLDTALLISTFGEDEAGELYLAHRPDDTHRCGLPHHSLRASSPCRGDRAHTGQHHRRRSRLHAARRGSGVRDVVRRALERRVSPDARSCRAHGSARASLRPTSPRPGPRR